MTPRPVVPLRVHKLVRRHGTDGALCNTHHPISNERLSFNWVIVTCIRCLIDGGRISRPPFRYKAGPGGDGRPLAVASRAGGSP